MEGILNTTLPVAVVTAVTTFIWPFVQGDAALIVIASIYGCVRFNFSELLRNSFDTTHDIA